MTTMKNMWASMTFDLTSGMAQARADRILRRQLRSELSAYKTEHEIIDLLAAVERSDAPEADEVRSILESNLTEMRRPMSLAS
ncbi:MAG: hypothetical protein WAW88_08665 [Nocardioides sp.]